VQVSAAPDRSTVVRADPVALDQIVHNLLLNALQAMDAPSVSRRQLAVSVGAEGAQGWLSVSDTGPGLPQDVLPRVFEPFFSTREGGLGLGLSLSESLAQGMGGRLMAENLPAGGARFTLWLPLDRD
jgi:C4-dicarboxylate-specific signal transduction histidine kinase